MREFPHLKDTRFPNLDTVDVYKFQNAFDYTRWNEDTKIKLVNVIWNSDYSDVVKFDTDSARDSYFDNITDFYAVELMQAARIVPDNSIKLPIPYDVMARYNYLYVDMPIATSANAPIDYEKGYGLRRWYFFVDDVAYLAPNTTQVFLTLDVWTNFQNDVEINYMMLERGHAPVFASDTDEYLADPINNNRYLLAPDVNYDNADAVRSSDYVPFGNGTKYVCIASTCSLEQTAELGTVTTNPAYAPLNPSAISYSDTSARYGHQLEVHGLTMGNGRDYSDARTPATAAQTNSRTVANNLMVYAIPASECYVNGTFFDDVMTQCPQFMNTIQACFVVDERCIEFQYPCTIAGHELWTVIGSRLNLLTKQLTQNDFNFPTELRRFAKLYTSPYSTLEVTDNDGTTFEINIEETATLSLKAVTSIAFPYIDYKVYLEGVGSSGATSYYWVDLAGQREELRISNSDWFKYCFDWSIPTFALYMDGETAYQLANFNRGVNMGIQNALVGYHNAMRSANTGMENARDSADATLENVQRSTQTAHDNAFRSAATAQTNANNNAETAHQNAYNSAETAETNANNAADTAEDNAYDSAETMYVNVDNSCTTIKANNDIANATLKANTERENACSESLTASSNLMDTGIKDDKNLLMIVTTEVENQTTAATSSTNAIGSVGSGALGGVTGGAGFGATVGTAIFPGMGTAAGAGIGAIGGAIMGAATSGANAIAAVGNSTVITQAREDVTNATIDSNNDIANASHEWAMDMTLDSNGCKTDVCDNNIVLSESQTNNNNANDRRNANNSRVTAKGNATRSKDTAHTNAANTRGTTETNADNARDTAETNAQNTRDTSENNADAVYTTDRANAQNTHDTIFANSGHTRQVEELNAKEILENAAQNAMARVLDARNAPPSKIGITGGNPSADALRTRGVQLKVKTQSDSAIRQTGDMFARFGYALNQVWNVRESGLKLMRHFTYWKASDIWVDDRQSSNNMVQNIISRIFMQGVTVWNDPTEIGRVSVYDN